MSFASAVVAGEAVSQSKKKSVKTASSKSHGVSLVAGNSGSKKKTRIPIVSKKKRRGSLSSIDEDGEEDSDDDDDSSGSYCPPSRKKHPTMHCHGAFVEIWCSRFVLTI